MGQLILNPFLPAYVFAKRRSVAFKNQITIEFPGITERENSALIRQSVAVNNIIAVKVFPNRTLLIDVLQFAEPRQSQLAKIELAPTRPRA
jgi:hypothetical protein